MPVSETSLSTKHLLRLDCRELLLGMFVSELDRSWQDTPFPIGGFHLRKAEDLQLLMKFCKHVTIDTNRGAEPPRLKQNQLTILSSARKAAPASAALKVKRDTYPVTQTLKQLIDKAHRAYTDLQEKFHAVTLKVREGHNLGLASLEKDSEILLEVIIANPQAMIWILNTNSNTSHPTGYCVRAAIWASTLARQIGLSRSDMEVLFLGTLLCDIGMHLLPERLVNKQGPFRKKEFLAYRKHVDFGLDLLSAYSELDERVLRIVRCHHERHDGLGFPRGVRGEQIPALARFANLAYCFERLVGTNSEMQKVSAAKAMAKLYKQRELKFPEQMIVEFIHVMGMYPVGTIVELSSGELALVLEQNEDERMFPKVALISDDNKNLLAEPKLVDLSGKKKSANDRMVSHSVEPASFRLNTEAYTFKFCGKRLGIGPLKFRL